MQRLAGFTSCMLLFLTLTDKAHADITCTAVTTSSRTTVVCHFGVDISESKHDFNVQFYYPDLKSDHESTLMCNHGLDGKLTCHSVDDVIFNKTTVGDTMTFTRPASLDKVGGQYVCQLLPTVRFQPCELTRVESSKTSPAPEEDMVSQSTEDGARETDDKTLKRMVVAVLVLLSLLVFFCVVVSVLWIWRRRPTKWWQKTDEVENQASKDQHNASEGPDPKKGKKTSAKTGRHQASASSHKADVEAAAGEKTSAQTDRHQASASSHTADVEAAAGEKTSAQTDRHQPSASSHTAGVEAAAVEKTSAQTDRHQASASSHTAGVEAAAVEKVEMQPLTPKREKQEETVHDVAEELEASSPMLKKERGAEGLGKHFESKAEMKEADKKFRQQQKEDLALLKEKQKQEMKRLEERLKAENKPSGEMRKQEMTLETQQNEQMKRFKAQQTAEKKQWQKHQQAESRRLSQQAKDHQKKEPPKNDE